MHRRSHAAFNLVVEIEGVAVGAFSECTGLGSETAAIEYREGKEPKRARKISGLTKYKSVTLRHGITRDLTLWKWRQQIVDGIPDRRSIVIVLLDTARNVVMRWRLHAAWPSKFVAPDLNAQGNEVAIETLELAHEGLDRDP